MKAFTCGNVVRRKIVTLREHVIFAVLLCIYALEHYWQVVSQLLVENVLFPCGGAVGQMPKTKVYL